LVLDKTLQMMVADGFSVSELTYSPIKGGQGNIEFLAVLTRSESPEVAAHIQVEKVLADTYQDLNGENHE
jgi:23S rRNA (cytidine1920-2'-O)/16S rRNA (cytidine1409-2'-O)-methyltransferase